ncbi:methylated-DNA--[protein]-cysteine S-methyltransferase [Gammaproteobacteria bacterium]|nr:methylated-DNA--[protein]-cysteine S-methyltransferase [Gammaproteobacteria bacterium]MDC0545774.1 methylated-DNA--[protein]-cysteine S-methyltransferase [Gammaproteobacteria bacterium]|tara:strand:- start:1632 stop:2090 length:459 start_codon:yes stop_codon:yes gene_type:complete
MFLKSLFHSPIGDIGLLADEENILSLSFTNQTFEGLKTKKSDERFKELSLQLNQYFFERLKVFNIQYKLSSSDFSMKVYQEMKKIKYGKTLSYSAIAEKIGRHKAFRAVGTSCGKNPLPIIIPCHRVLAKNGLGGFTGGLEIKKFLLTLERN